MPARGLKNRRAAGKNAGSLRRGITTGACAAACAKAAARLLLARLLKKKAAPAESVSLSLPRGGVVAVKIKKAGVKGESAFASVIKDAGDDPDVTNKAEITATARLVGRNKSRPSVRIVGGQGVGLVTRPGLKIAPGESAINPVPRRMIKQAVLEEARRAGAAPAIEITVSVPKGEALAKRTLNPRLGIIGGISILGTTGIVEPMSLAAYRHSITAGLDVAVAMGQTAVVLSTGRSSELVAEKALKLHETAYILTGDHMGFAIKEAVKRRQIKKIIIAGQFGKFSKLSAGHFETHCSDSSVDVALLAEFCSTHGAGAEAVGRIQGANTARHAYFILKDAGLVNILKALCKAVKKNSLKIAGGRVGVSVLLAGYENDVVCVC